MDRRKLYGLLFLGAFAATLLLVMAAGDRAGFGPGAARDFLAPASGPDREGRGSDARSRRDPRPAPGQRSAEEKRLLQERLVFLLRHMYGDRISRTSQQAMLAQARIQVMSLFPGEGEERFRDILRQAFPGHVDQILATLGKVDDFDRWLGEQAEQLEALDPEEREQAVRDKQKEMFGEEAAEDFAAQDAATEARNQAMHDTMQVLEESSDTTLDQKLDVYVDALQENYADSTGAWALENTGLLAQTFFGLESVSRQLAELDPEARQEKINEIRREFGFDEEQVAALEEQDARRNARWENGLAYMDERRQLADRFSGQRLEQELDALRERYFAHEARTIKLEEGDGFFRFERPRLHGRN